MAGMEVQHAINIFKLKATGAFKNTVIFTEVSMLLLLYWMFHAYYFYHGIILFLFSLH